MSWFVFAVVEYVYMNQAIQIVTPKDNTPGVRSFRAAALDLGFQLDVLLVNDKSTQHKLNSDSPAIYRFGPESYRKFESLAEVIDNQKQKSLLTSNLVAFDKCLSYKILEENEVSQPQSEVRTLSGAIPTLPVVIKPPFGNQGNGVELIKTEEGFRSFEAEYLDKYGQLLVQSYIPESKGSDKRLIIAQGALVAAMKRSAVVGDFRANLHQGGSASQYDPTDQEVALAIKACQVLGLQFAGVDIIDSDNGPLILEVNPSPGLGISKVVGFDVAGAVLKKMFNV